MKMINFFDRLQVWRVEEVSCFSAVGKGWLDPWVYLLSAVLSGVLVVITPREPIKAIA